MRERHRCARDGSDFSEAVRVRVLCEKWVQIEALLERAVVGGVKPRRHLRRPAITRGNQFKKAGTSGDRVYPTDSAKGEEEPASIAWRVGYGCALSALSNFPGALCACVRVHV